MKEFDTELIDELKMVYVYHCGDLLTPVGFDTIRMLFDFMNIELLHYKFIEELIKTDEIFKNKDTYIFDDLLYIAQKFCDENVNYDCIKEFLEQTKIAENGQINKLKFTAYIYDSIVATNTFKDNLISVVFKDKEDSLDISTFESRIN